MHPPIPLVLAEFQVDPGLPFVLADAFVLHLRAPKNLRRQRRAEFRELLLITRAEAADGAPAADGEHAAEDLASRAAFGSIG